MKPQPPLGCEYGINGAKSHAICSAIDNPSTWVPPTPKSKDHRLPCPYGQPGDRIVMLTTWATEKQYDGTKPARLPDNARIWSLWDGDTKPEWCGRLRPGRFLPVRFRHLMPRSEITDVRVERVQDITEEDAKAEGLVVNPKYLHAQLWTWDGVAGNSTNPVYAYQLLWDSINSKRGFGWDSNPWVWAITFKKL